MKRLLFLSLAFALAFLFVACDSGNTGDFKITLKLPIDYDSVCQDYSEDEEDSDGNDYTYCINESDQVLLSIYSKSEIKDDYVYADRKLIKVTNNIGGKEEFIRSLKKGTYYRFFVEVTNKNEKLKLTGGIDGVYYDDKNNYDVDIFLAAVGDFVRVVSDRQRSDENSLETYFETDGSKGSAAVALKDGSIYMAGGYSFQDEDILQNAAIFNMRELERKDVKNLPAKLYDHIVAFLDDGTEKGKVIVGLGMTEDDSLNDSVWVYDPESDKYELLALGAAAMTKAKAITIDGSVYLVGGCSASGASKAVYKIASGDNGVYVEKFADLNEGRCNHAVADVSIVNVDENGVKTVTPRLLVIGGSTNYTPEGKEAPVIGANFAELVTKGASKPLDIAARNGVDDSNLKVTGLISATAVSILMDDKEEDETIVAVLGGYLRNGDSDDAVWVTNPSLFVFSEKGEDALVYDANSTPNECSRPSAALLGSQEKSVLKYVAVNCGSNEIDRTARYASDQIVFVLQVKRVKDSDLGMEVFSSSVKDTLMDENKDKDSDAVLSDGPVAVDGLGQVFMLGGKYVYQVGSYAVP